MAVLSRDQILSASDAQIDEIDVPEWGGTVRIRSITAAQQKEIARIQNATNKTEVERYAKARLLMLVYGLIDKAGEPLFTEDDLEALDQKMPGVINRLTNAIGDLSGISEAAVEAAEGKAASG